MLQVFIQNISSVFRRMFASVFALDVAYVSHMLQEYVPMVSVVSILCCCSVSCCKLQVFYLDVADVSHTCFKCMSKIFHLL